MIQFGRYTCHVIICLITLSLGCEWKPPRRAQSTRNKILQVVNKENAKRHSESRSNVVLQPKIDATVTHTKTPMIVNQAVQHSSTLTPIIKEEVKTAEVKTTDVKEERIQHTSSQSSTAFTNIEPITVEEVDYLYTIEQDAPPELYLKSLQIGTSIKRRRLLGEGTKFGAQEKQLKAYLIVRNFDTPQHIAVRWFNENKLIKRDRLKIGVSPRWRTWTTLRRPAQFGTGSWKIEVYSNKRKLLARTSFYIENHE